MATLDSIATGQLLAQEACSMPEAIAHQILYANLRKRHELFEIFSGHLPEGTQDGELKRTIEQVGKLATIWSIFKTIENITDILEHIEEKLVRIAGPDGTVSYASEESPDYQRFLGAAVDDASGMDDRAVIKDGIVCHAATKWYAVRVRHLIRGVGTKAETDWFWKTFGEHHHMDLVAFRNQLVHMTRLEDYTPIKLSEQSDWFIERMKSISRMIRRTSIAVPDSTGANNVQFATEEIAALPKRQEHEQLSASNALVTITMETDATSDHPCKFGFISFDTDTNTLTAHDGLTFGYAALE